MIKNLFQDLSNFGSTIPTGDKKFRFDFCAPDKLGQFYGADYYILKEFAGEDKYEVFANLKNRHDIYKTVMKRVLEKGCGNSLFDFKRYINGVRILSYLNNKTRYETSSGFIYHFSTELYFEKQPYFLVDGRWYKLKKTFIDDLKYRCIETLQSNKLPKNILNQPWDKTKIKKEAEYNLMYNNLNNYIVLDTITPDGIELCDILFIEQESIYLIHVKHGFNHSMRELTNQICLSARRLYQDLNSGSYEYLDKIFDSLVNKKLSHKISSKEDFRKVFIKKKKVYVLAFASHQFEDKLVEENIDKYTSNIAKYSLIECSQEMKTLNYELNIRQIRRA